MQLRTELVHNSTTTISNNTKIDDNMPFHFWTQNKKADFANLKHRVCRLEDANTCLATKVYVCNHWRKMAETNGLTRRLQALEQKQKDMDAVLLQLMVDVTIAERKLDKVLTFDETEAKSESVHVSKTEDARSNTPPNLSPLELPTTFTRRRGNSVERTTLDTESLRLSRAGRHAETHAQQSEVKSLQGKISNGRLSDVSVC